MVPNLTFIYHIASIENLHSILKNNGLVCSNQLHKDGTSFVNIAYEQIQSRRSEKQVPLPPYGNLHDYVPFYFAPRSPMLYTINLGNVPQYEGGQEPIIYLVSTVQQSIFNPRYIINFPTKRHWKGKSKIEDIKSGLIDFVEKIREYGIKSVAIPPLGCGNGGLDWDQVRPLIEESALKVPDVLFMVYPPVGTPEPDKMPVGTEKPKLTRARALLIMLMNLYAAPGYKLSMLEIQKLAYFLQECGEDLKLRFVKAQYGPYADNLNHVLQRLEGHYIRGYGDRNRDAEIYLLPEVVREAEEFLSQLKDESTDKRLRDTKQIIEGYETPYGLELLATTDWTIKHYPDARVDVKRAIDHFKAWNERKKKVFKETHIEMAWRHLTQVYKKRN